MRRTASVAIVAAVLLCGLWLFKTHESAPIDTSVATASESLPVAEIASAQSLSASDPDVPSTTQGPALVMPGAPTETALKPRGPAQSAAQSVPTSTPIPIDVSPGFESLLTPPVDPPDTSPSSAIVRRHRQLVSEARDEAWAGRVEPDIQAYIEKALAAQGLDPQRIELSVLECRTSGCEIQAAATRVQDGMKLNGPQLLFEQVVRGPLAGDLEPRDMMVMVTTLPDGRHGYIAFLPRKQP